MDIIFVKFIIVTTFVMVIMVKKGLIQGENFAGLGAKFKREFQ